MDFLDLFYDERADLVITSRNGPHWKQAGKIHFVTWRQADSLAKEKLGELQRDRKAWLERHKGKDLSSLTSFERRAYYRLFHERVERWLDAGAGSCVLRRPGPRTEVVDALHYFNGQRYRLGSFAVAGNHVHVLVVPLAEIDLSVITHTWKSYTAKTINRMIGRAGTLWRQESFDHLVRTEESLVNFEKYIGAHDRQGAYTEHRALLSV